MIDSENKLENPSSLLFEYPLQENVRGYLRLESLFKQYRNNMKAKHPQNHFHALKILFEILEILARGDTRSALIKELSRLRDYFQQLDANPKVDSSKLLHFLKQIEQLHQWVHAYQGKFGESIRKHPFIASVTLRNSIPGGSCSFDCPELHLFLNRSSEERRQSLNDWIKDIKGIETSLDVILRLLREKGQWRIEKAPLGSFVLETNPQQPFKLLRIKEMEPLECFPEFSCGKHRSSIHFMRFNQQHKKIPMNQAIRFSLACC